MEKNASVALELTCLTSNILKKRFMGFWIFFLSFLLIWKEKKTIINIFSLMLDLGFKIFVYYSDLLVVSKVRPLLNTLCSSNVIIIYTFWLNLNVALLPRSWWRLQLKYIWDDYEHKWVSKGTYC
jgi:hypothetical protein